MICCIQPPADMSELPEPPVPEDLDLRHFSSMGLDLQRLFNSEIWEETTGDEFKGAVRLWGKSWWQVPASSLPNDEKKIAQLAGYGGNLRGWKRDRNGVLRGFQLCRDGRLYHFVVADQALSSEKKSRAGKRGAKKRWNKSKALKHNTTGAKSPSSKGDGRDHSKADDTLYGNGNSKPDGKPMPRREGNTLPPLPPLPDPDGTVSLAAPPPRPIDPTEPVEVELETGAKLRITRTGQVDEIYAPRDCPPTALTRQQALDLRAKAIADRARDGPDQSRESTGLSQLR